MATVRIIIATDYYVMILHTTNNVVVMQCAGKETREPTTKKATTGAAIRVQGNIACSDTCDIDRLLNRTPTSKALKKPWIPPYLVS